jgi:hypothetical protein
MTNTIDDSLLVVRARTSESRAWRRAEYSVCCLYAIMLSPIFPSSMACLGIVLGAPLLSSSSWPVASRLLARHSPGTLGDSPASGCRFWASRQTAPILPATRQAPVRVVCSGAFPSRRIPPAPPRCSLSATARPREHALLLAATSGRRLCALSSRCRHPSSNRHQLLARPEFT